MKKNEKSLDLGHWTTNLQDFDTIPFGFIYEITNTVTNKKYIGKKQCVTVLKRKPLKGKTKKRHEKVETDWKSYTSSSRELNEDIIKYGKDKFTFEIIRICESKFELAYFEAKLQFEREVLLNEQYYNGIINLRVSKPKRFQA
jgi:hypothetical protein